MSSQLLDELRVRVDAMLEPHVDIRGEDAPEVKMARKIVLEAEKIERQLLERRVSTTEAARRKRWAPETLQKYARAKLNGEKVPSLWAGLIVEEIPGIGFAFVLDSIPDRPGRDA